MRFKTPNSESSAFVSKERPSISVGVSLPPINTGATTTSTKSNTFRLAIRDIARAEAPLSEEFLLKRIVRAFGREKVTKVVVNEFNTHMKGCEKNGILRRDGFLYMNNMEEIRLRVPGDRREVKYIAIEELADWLLTLIRQNVTATRDGLYKTLANLLGFTRASEAMTARFEEALHILKTAGKVIEENGTLTAT